MTTDITKEPETPQEVAEFKAAERQKNRNNTTFFNLTIALVACLAAVAIMVFMVVRPEGSLLPVVDYEQVTANSRSGYSEHIAAPEIPEGWWLNSAGVRMDQSDRQHYWYVGFITDSDTFIALNQRVATDDLWPVRLMDSTLPSGSVDFSGVTWTEFDRSVVTEGQGNKPYGLSLNREGNTVVLHGNASQEDFAKLITQLNGLVTPLP